MSRTPAQLLGDPDAVPTRRVNKRWSAVDMRRSIDKRQSAPNFRLSMIKDLPSHRTTPAPRTSRAPPSTSSPARRLTGSCTTATRRRCYRPSRHARARSRTPRRACTPPARRALRPSPRAALRRLRPRHAPCPSRYLPTGRRRVCRTRVFLANGRFSPARRRRARARTEVSASAWALPPVSLSLRRPPLPASTRPRAPSTTPPGDI
jgi:hypothetical protein